MRADRLAIRTLRQLRLQTNFRAIQVQEIIIDYTRCHLDAPEYPATTAMPSDLVTMHFKKNSSNTANRAAPSWTKKTDFVNQYFNGSTVVANVTNSVLCTINFTIPNEMTPPVLFYYRLTNFYQNHRRYAKSFNTDQLLGKAVSASTIDGSDCTPLKTVTVDGVKKPYYPCGLAANSQFNDTFSSPVLLDVPGGGNVQNETYVMQNTTDISWSTDRKLYGPTSYSWSDIVPPPNWIERYPKNYTDDHHPDLVNDSGFQVWMRLAGLPTFSKLVQRNDTTSMQAGTYTLDIVHRMSPYYLSSF